MDIKVLGSTTHVKSYLLVNNLEEAFEELDMEPTYEKVNDLAAMNKYGVYEIPALVINDTVKTKGRIPTVDEIKSILQ